MKTKKIILVLGIISLCVFSWAIESITCLKDGKKIINTIVDISRRTGHVQYLKNKTKIHRSKIWMINYVNKKWNFPSERLQLPQKLDTIFLRNGTKMVGHIVDYSSRRHVFELKNGRSVPDHRIRRIYFCCVKLPAAYKRIILIKKSDSSGKVKREIKKDH